MGGDWRHVDEAVIDVYEPEPEIIHYRRAEQMGLIQAEEPCVYGNVVREIEVRSADATGESAAEGSLQTAGPKWQLGFRIREKESGAQLVFAGVEFLIPVRGELVIVVFSRLANQKLARRPGCACYRGDQESVGIVAEVSRLSQLQKRV